jgi:2-oxoisovalerate dehydrogenase E1 component
MKDIDILPDFTPGTIEFNPIPKYLYRSNLAEEIAAGRLDKTAAVRIFKVMLMNRHVEDLIVDMKEGRFSPVEGFKFSGATHLSIGQEAVAAGAISAIRWTDSITSTHRGHGHSIAKGAFRIYAMTREELNGFVGGGREHLGDGELLESALDHHLYKTICELFGKEDGYCRGRGGGMHIADFNARHLGANAIVGGSYAIGAGAGLAQFLLRTGSIVVTIVGDGAANNGIAHEAMNFAAQCQFGQGLPVIFLVENNQYGMTGQQCREVTGVRYLAQRGAGYNAANMNAEVVNGMDVLAVHDAVRRAAEKCRRGEGPVLLECMTYRYMGHSLSDGRMSYRSPEEEKAWKDKDPIVQFRSQLIGSGVMTEAEADAAIADIRTRTREIAVRAAQSADPKPEEIYDGLWSGTTSEGIGDTWRTPETELLKPVRNIKRMAGGKILCRHAVWEALAEEMVRDRRVVVYGEDVADYGGAFGVTMGLLETFGRKRVFNAPISEAAIVGTACGAAMSGLRPVAEIMYIDFIPLALDQLGNQVAKARYMFGGKAKIPLVIRTTIGGGKGYAGQHSQSLEAIVAHFPGLKVAAPFTAYDAKGLLKTAIRDDDPVVFIEHQLLYADLGVVPEPDEEYLIPFGRANVLREGKDITLISYLHLLKNTLAAADLLREREGIEAEVVDLRTLVPLDTELIRASARKTGRCAVVIQAPLTCSFAEHVAFDIQRNLFGELKMPVEIISAHAVPPPMATPLENENIPSPERIYKTVSGLLKN